MRLRIDAKLVEDAHILLHPIRYNIMALLSEKPMYINELAKAMDEERRLVSFHLTVLEEHGFVGSKYEMSEEKKSKGKAIRKYWANEKLQTIIHGIRTEI